MIEIDKKQFFFSIPANIVCVQGKNVHHTISLLIWGSLQLAFLKLIPLYKEQKHFDEVWFITHPVKEQVD